MHPAADNRALHIGANAGSGEMMNPQNLTMRVFPEAVKAGSFGADVTKFVSFEVDGRKAAVDQFSSKVIFGDVTLEKSTGEQIIQPVVIKIRRLPEIKAMLDSDIVFHNEVLFYSEIMPCLKKYDTDGFLATCLSEFVYGKATNGEHPEEDILVLKNLNQRGFKLSEERMYLDEKHVKLALDRLAKFHALSIAFLMDDPDRFNQLVNRCKLYLPINLEFFPEEMFPLVLNRGVEPLKNDSKYRDRLPDLCANLRNALEHYKKSLTRSGPLTALVHGDFQRNNMMFKYGTNGDPIEVAFFDFQTIKPNSPALDLSVFLSVNVAPEVRESLWDEFLRTYYGTLSSQLADNPLKPSFEMFELDLRKNGIYGYYICAIAGPSAMSRHENPEFSVWESMEEEQLKEHMRKSLSYMKDIGGKKGTDMVVALVKHMLDRKYIFGH